MKKTIITLLTSLMLFPFIVSADNIKNNKDTLMENKKQEETTNAAFIYIAPGNDPQVHRSFIDSPVIKLTVVGVKDYDQAVEIALELVESGTTAIELCAGFGNEGTARIAKAVGDKALVGVVRFDLHPAFNHQSGDKVFDNQANKDK